MRPQATGSPPGNGEARVAAGSGEAAQQTTDNAKRTGGRTENQGLLPQRCATQRVPVWEAPAGHDAALLLARRMNFWRRS